MKNFIFLVALLVTFFAAGSRTASAQEKRLSSSPKIFRTFFAKFRSAVERADKTAVASMTRFPFKYGFDEGNEGTMSRAQFLRRFNYIFGESPKRFFTEKNPVFSRGEAGSYVITTDAAVHLVFVKKGNGFMFRAYIAEP